MFKKSFGLFMFVLSSNLHSSVLREIHVAFGLSFREKLVNCLSDIPRISRFFFLGGGYLFLSFLTQIPETTSIVRIVGDS